ncbi:hypothetical protein HPB50_026520 [Hyalomma asiaticum]|uniref:Uncharacterized protein n=1 Tax=Hyalomma asiaticum TaxID=266040 RepID=A0ACB7S9A4_HYAAI|nr:hypothetical protein HPB50_026520 [Hyalomma asiaticum]
MIASPETQRTPDSTPVSSPGGVGRGSRKDTPKGRALERAVKAYDHQLSLSTRGGTMMVTGNSVGAGNSPDLAFTNTVDDVFRTNLQENPAVMILSMSAMFCIDRVEGFQCIADFERQAFEEPVINDTRSHVLVCTYTSGTSGLPKGVEVSMDAYISSLEINSVLHHELLLQSLSWSEIEDMHLLRNVPRRNLRKNGPINLEYMEHTTFYRSFRFHKGDLDDLMTGLLIPDEVESAQRVRVPGREALCMMLRRLAYPNRLCDLELLFFNRHSSAVSSVVSKVLAHIQYSFAHLVADLTVHKWLSLQS